MDRPSTILVVDESAAARWVLASTLRGHGYEALEAADGGAALDQLAGGEVDAVLLDCKVRGLPSLEVLKRIREQKSPTYLPVLMVTDDPTSDCLLRALENGASDYLLKPICLPILRARLEAYLAHRRAEKELLTSRQLLKDVIDSLPQRIGVRDRGGRLVLANAALARDFPELSLGTTFRQAMEIDVKDPGYAHWLQELGEMHDRVRASGFAEELPESLDRRAAGQERFRRLCMYPLVDSAGKSTGVVTWSEDVTERVVAERELRASRRLLQNVIDSFPQRIAIRDLKGGFLYRNTALLREHRLLFGSEPEGALGTEGARKDYPATVIDVFERVAHMIKDVIATSRAAELPQYSMPGLDGQPSIRRLMVFPLMDAHNETTGVVIWTEDITERAQSEQELRSGRQLLQNVIDSFPQRIAVRDRQGKLLFRNAALVREYEALFGLREEVGVRELDARHDLQPEVKETFRQIRGVMDQVLALRLPAELSDYPFPGLDGNPSIRRMVSFPLLDSQGELQGQVSWSEDITERLNTERSLRQAVKLDAVGRLAGGIAHDFGNVMQVVRGYTQLALAEAAALQGGVESGGRILALLNNVLKSSDQGANLSRQLLTFSRGGKASPQALDLNRHLRERLDMLRMAVGSGVKVVFQLGTEWIPIVADAGMLDQVLLNLSINARDAMPGGGSLTIETTALRTVTAFPQPPAWAKAERYARISFRDTGTGMTSHVLDHLFEPFFTTKGEGKGTGLGLSVVHGIVAQHRGQILVESTIGQGTTFHVYLPCCDERIKAEAHSANPAEQGPGAAAD